MHNEAFQQGFHDRCAEYGIDGEALKQAAEGPFLSDAENKADKNRKKGKPAVTTSAKDTEETPKSLAKKIKDGYSVGTVNK
jgi:hypothetical protein